MSLGKRMCLFLLVLAVLTPAALGSLPHQKEAVLQADGTAPPPPPIPIPWSRFA